jgi:hypothetical protein
LSGRLNRPLNLFLLFQSSFQLYQLFHSWTMLLTYLRFYRFIHDEKFVSNRSPKIFISS